MRERQNRSDKYQYVIVEVSCSHDLLSSFSNGNSISYLLNPYKYDEETLLLQDQLKEEVWKLAKEICSERQWKILQMYMSGMTQQEIAKELGVNQSSVTKNLHGNTDYVTYNGQKKKYGGTIKKMKKAIAKHQTIQNLLKVLNESQEEKL